MDPTFRVIAMVIALGALLLLAHCDSQAQEPLPPDREPLDVFGYRVSTTADFPLTRRVLIRVAPGPPFRDITDCYGARTCRMQNSSSWLKKGKTYIYTILQKQDLGVKN